MTGHATPEDAMGESSKQWGVFNGHVIPLDDLREHDESLACWCQPTPDHDEPNVIVHHSADLREQYEEGRKMS